MTIDNKEGKSHKLHFAYKFTEDVKSGAFKNASGVNKKVKDLSPSKILLLNSNNREELLAHNGLQWLKNQMHAGMVSVFDPFLDMVDAIAENGQELTPEVEEMLDKVLLLQDERDKVMKQHDPDEKVIYGKKIEEVTNFIKQFFEVYKELHNKFASVLEEHYEHNKEYLKHTIEICKNFVKALLEKYGDAFRHLLSGIDIFENT